MRPLTPPPMPGVRAARRQLPVVTALLTCLVSGQAIAGCPWIVQPSKTIGGDLPDYDITFNRDPDPSWSYYAFTVTDHELAWELSSGSGLAALDERGRPLEIIDEGDRVRYRVDAASAMPLTIYLVVSTSPMAKLDSIAADFEPARPFAVGMRMRGASDTSGPLPHRSLPGVEIHYASAEAKASELDTDRSEYQLCAYQVLIR